jgi:cysteine synthase A
LIRLKGPSDATGCNIYGKCEWENPGGSVKDRAALWMVRAAENDGTLVHGQRGAIVEGTAGNTGIGLALAGRARGYDVFICLADTQSIEKKDALRQAGATLVEVPACPFSNPNHFVHVAERLAQAVLKGAEYGSNVLYANQWDNPANRQSHIEGTGPEIWHQTGGKIDCFSCATGTGGTLNGTGTYLRDISGGKCKIALTDPCGAAVMRWFTEGELRSEGGSISEGIGQGRITGNMGFDDFRPDLFHEVSDDDMMPMLQQLQREEGLAIGGSAGINVQGAIQVATELGPGHTIVTMLCDRADRYASKLYNEKFLRSKDLPVPSWVDSTRPSSENLAKALEIALDGGKE